MRAMLGLGLSAVLLTTVFVWGQATTLPSGTGGKADAKESIKGVRLVEPFSDLEDLSPEQTTQLKEIHKKYHDQIAQLEAKEKQESLALLNDKQKQEVEAIEAKRKAEMEQHRAAATTRPSSPTTKP